MFRMTNNAASGPRLRAFFAHLMLPLLIWSSQPRLGCGCSLLSSDGGECCSAVTKCSCGTCQGRSGHSCCGRKSGKCQKSSVAGDIGGTCHCRTVLSSDLIVESRTSVSAIETNLWAMTTFELPATCQERRHVATRATILSPASPHDLLASLQRFVI